MGSETKKKTYKDFEPAGRLVYLQHGSELSAGPVDAAFGDVVPYIAVDARRRLDWRFGEQHWEKANKKKRDYHLAAFFPGCERYREKSN